MSQGFSIQREGDIELLVPTSENGKVTSEMPAFYNPAMAANRDIAVACIAAFTKGQDRRIAACDFLAATGVRGLRYLGVEGLHEVHMNDIRPSALELIFENLKRNYRTADVRREEGKISCKVDDKTVFITTQEAHLFLAEHKRSFDVVDLDPFGSPAEFLPSALRSARHRSMLCVTATDTATLCGRYPRTCARRYLATPLKTSYKHETGLRTLAGYVTRLAASMEVAARPVLSHATAHYYRVYFKLRGSRSAADSALGSVGWAAHCARCDARETFTGFLPPSPRCCGEPMSVFGPLWIEGMNRPAFVQAASENLPPCATPEARKVMEGLSREIDTFSYFDLHHLASLERRQVPPTDSVVEELLELGYRVSPTHITPIGLKTDAPAKELTRIIRRIS